MTQTSLRLEGDERLAKWIITVEEAADVQNGLTSSSQDAQVDQKEDVSTCASDAIRLCIAPFFETLFLW